MFCPYCAAKCEDSHRFCHRCGRELPSFCEEEPAVEEACEEEILTDTPVDDSIDETEPAEISTEEEHIAPEAFIPEPVKKKGRIWPPVLALVFMIFAGLLTFFLLPYPDQTTPSHSETPWFYIEDEHLYFDPTLYTGSAELVIPETVNGETVTRIGEYAFYDCDYITTVILPETLTHIGEYAFGDCNSLRGIFIHENVHRISNHAFYNCDALEAIYLSDDLEHMGEDALGNCNRLAYIFYNGSYESWCELYDGEFVSNVELQTKDGVYNLNP